MRVRWSQLVYRSPGSDNAIGLARVIQTKDGEVLQFADQMTGVGEKAVGYLALLPLALGMEEELDEWVEVDPEEFLERDSRLWETESHSPDVPLYGNFRQLWSALSRWWKWQSAS